MPADDMLHSGAGKHIPSEPDEDGFFWWKGNLHTHTLWSDGGQFPEVVTQWYYQHGYHFLALSEHHVLSSGVVLADEPYYGEGFDISSRTKDLIKGQKWINPKTFSYADRGGGMEGYELYRNLFGDEWIETREVDGELKVRLKSLDEIRTLFEEPGRFVMIESNEITERGHGVHVNATNIRNLIKPQTGATVEETIRLNIDAVVKQSEKTGQDMIPHLNHPNNNMVVTAEDMAPIENLRLFEVYNGHRSVIDFGDDIPPKDLDRVWDIVLTRRLGELDLGLLYGLAADDAHHYDPSTIETARPGRGWVMVYSRFLTPQFIIQALRNGDFYSSTGVTIESVQSDENNYKVQVAAEEGVDYTIRFIGTRMGYDSSSEPFMTTNGEVLNDRTRQYSDDIGKVFKEVRGHEATYEFRGDELYVRVKVISTKPKENYLTEGEREKAWLQPVRPASK